MSKLPQTLEKPEAVESTRAEPSRPWNVIVWNDPINLMTYVTFVFQKLFGFSLPVARRHMLEVHNLGRSCVATVAREKAEYYVARLHSHGLQATLEQVSP